MGGGGDVDEEGEEDEKPAGKAAPAKRIEKIVLWNTHNSGFNDRGAKVCDVALFVEKKRYGGRKI